MEQQELAELLASVLFELEIDITTEQLLEAAENAGVVFNESPT